MDTEEYINDHQTGGQSFAFPSNKSLDLYSDIVVYVNQTPLQTRRCSQHATVDFPDSIRIMPGSVLKRR